ncbi:MAG: hypothetical protein JSS64_00090 [Bacteroidetes bacterium]|nr:hypothetical protein [Bacteroidota bacterium]
MTIKKLFTLMTWALALLFSNVHAAVWRINNNAGVNANFTNPSSAISSNLVHNGDTLYIEGSATNYGSITLNKRLVIIGTGYFLSGSNNNSGLQANPNNAVIGDISLDSLGTGSVIEGLQFNNIYNTYNAQFADSMVITRCYLSSIGNYYPASGTVANKWKVNKCYIANSVDLGGATSVNWDFRNNIVGGTINLSASLDTANIIRNNVFRSSVNIYNAYVINNTFVYFASITLTNSVVKNNIASGQPSGFSTYQGTNGNSWNYTEAQIFKGLSGNSYDVQWQLATGSPAIAAGLTIGSVVTPDCGAFGGPDPYVLSGIPPIPTIYSLTVPASIPSGTPSMNITFSSQNNN